MCQYSFITSDKPLIEVDYSGFIEIKVKDVKKLNLVPNPPAIYSSWDEMDQETCIVYAKDDSDLTGCGLDYVIIHLMI